MPIDYKEVSRAIDRFLDPAFDFRARDSLDTLWLIEEGFKDVNQRCWDIMLGDEAPQVGQQPLLRRQEFYARAAKLCDDILTGQKVPDLAAKLIAYITNDQLAELYRRPAMDTFQYVLYAFPDFADEDLEKKVSAIVATPGHLAFHALSLLGTIKRRSEGSEPTRVDLSPPLNMLFEPCV